MEKEEEKEVEKGEQEEAEKQKEGKEEEEESIAVVSKACPSQELCCRHPAGGNGTAYKLLVTVSNLFSPFYLRQISS